MNGPRLVCAACGDTTTINKPICDACLGAGLPGNAPFCALCWTSVPLDATGLMHVTKTGGHAGPCTAIAEPR